MGSTVINAVELLARIIREHSPEDIWENSPLIGYRMLGNTNRGEIGEEFIRRFLGNAGFSVSNGNRTSEIDMVIEGQRTEVKTASLGANGTFQFNHVRLDRAYAFLLCLGICPEQIVFNVWSKDEVNDGSAGHLVMMAQDQDVTYKITKKLNDMRPIDELIDTMLERLAGDE